MGTMLTTDLILKEKWKWKKKWIKEKRKKKRNVSGSFFTVVWVSISETTFSTLESWENE